ncbi:hypothetical protein M409DRAFT_54735 [Zasmidium cellare ATCC 36951]|uniref:Sphingomyelin phosphodiesterase n=1 Tax=Zasmidium cellare ATCC 36951 TaxID=1080233 RepID=A0A6A6CI79_ZASCE|nr:uncharacterized protein M409DRAFT_54735 [Zasmidium cellare ATCC 36951]KAF2166977.1 hypothetical protein M409DRAFT_54735 [Zasmidium cellare ATCC 36951]
MIWTTVLHVIAIAASLVGAQDPLTTQQFISGIQGATTCGECQSALLTLKGIAFFGDDRVIASLARACKLTNAEDNDVCDGIMAQEGPILARAIREMDVPSHTSKLFCTTLMGLCDIPEVRPYNVTFPKPKPANLARPEPSGKSPIKFVHFSDIHVDLEYETGSNYNCTKPICCRSYTEEDAPGNNTYPAGPNGNHLCDVPKSLEESMYETIKDVASDAAFAIFTGDIPEHAVWIVEKAGVKHSIDSAYSTMAKILPMPVYGTLGNHEAVPCNSFPHQEIEDAISSQWVYDIVSKKWRTWIGNNNARIADRYGAYSYLVPQTKLRVISINTNLFYAFNFWVFEKEMTFDPDNQFAWLVSELQAAEDAGERVYIIGHMPPGRHDALYDGSNYLDQIVNRYEATIAAMFWGHTHQDHFELSYSDYSKRSHLTASMMSYISPSLTPTSGSPAFRVFTVDPDTFGVLDFEVYTAPLEAEGFQTTGPTWKPYYSAREAYGSLVNLSSSSAELTPAFWHNVTSVFESNDTAFQQYYSRKSRGWNKGNCTEECKVDEICQLRAAEAQHNCLTPSRGYALDSGNRQARLRGDESMHDECHSSRAAMVFQSLVGQPKQEIFRQDL